MTGTRSYTYKKNRAILKARTQQIDAPCAVCGKAFRWDVDWWHPLAYSTGHIIAIDDGGTDEMENLRPEHHSCNSSAGARLLLAKQQRLGLPSNVGRPRTTPVQPTVQEPIPDPKSQDWP